MHALHQITKNRQIYQINEPDFKDFNACKPEIFHVLWSPRSPYCLLSLSLASTIVYVVYGNRPYRWMDESVEQKSPWNYFFPYIYSIVSDAYHFSHSTYLICRNFSLSRCRLLSMRRRRVYHLFDLDAWSIYISHPIPLFWVDLFPPPELLHELRILLLVEFNISL